MSRFVVPVVFIAAVNGLALTLIIGIVARSPETHSNVRPEGFDRTPISYVGDEIPFAGLGLADPGLGSDPDPLVRGRLLYVNYGCATCHGLATRGGVVGPDLDLEELFLDDFRPLLRSGPGGMPAFTEEILSDDDLDTIYAFLKAIRHGAASWLSGDAQAQ
jgi:hypothetical protein